MSKDKPRFIRKNGKVIPIGGKKKDFAGAKKSARKVLRAEKTELDTSAKLEKRQTAFRAAGVVAGVSLGGALGSIKKAGPLGALAGILAGAGVGNLVGSRTKKSKALSKKVKSSRAKQLKYMRKGQKQVGKAFGNVYSDEFTKMVNSSTGF